VLPEKYLGWIVVLVVAVIKRFSKAFKQMARTVLVRTALCSRCPCGAKLLSRFSLSHCYGDG